MTESHVMLCGSHRVSGRERGVAASHRTVYRLSFLVKIRNWLARRAVSRAILETGWLSQRVQFLTLSPLLYTLITENNNGIINIDCHLLRWKLNSRMCGGRGVGGARMPVFSLSRKFHFDCVYLLQYSYCENGLLPPNYVHTK